MKLMVGKVRAGITYVLMDICLKGHFCLIDLELYSIVKKSTLQFLHIYFF